MPESNSPWERKQRRVAHREWASAFIDDDELRDTYTSDAAGLCYQQLADDISWVFSAYRLSPAARRNCRAVIAALRHLGKRLTAIAEERDAAHEAERAAYYESHPGAELYEH